MISLKGSAAMETPSETTSPRIRWTGLKTRAISACLLGTFVLAAVLAGGIFFSALIVVAAILMIREWDALTAAEGARWRAAGIAYVGVPCVCLIWMRSIGIETEASAGLHIVLYLLFTVWATDIGAYFAGRSIGGPKLAPALSPNKTWAGLAGGMAAASVVGGICASFTPFPPSAVACMLSAAALAVIAQGGDLFESWLKRRAGVKDSGTLIPGHGGILDRIDGLIFATPALALMLIFSGWAF